MPHRSFAAVSAAAAIAAALVCGSPASADPTAQTTPTTSSQSAHAATGPLFRVGTAVVDISPDKPMPVGGYGANYVVTNGVHDPLEVRAFFVGHGKDAVTFVSSTRRLVRRVPDAERR
jgi:hypothetical protein